MSKSSELTPWEKINEYLSDAADDPAIRNDNEAYAFVHWMLLLHGTLNFGPRPRDMNAVIEATVAQVKSDHGKKSSEAKAASQNKLKQEVLRIYNSKSWTASVAADSMFKEVNLYALSLTPKAKTYTTEKSLAARIREYIKS